MVMHDFLFIGFLLKQFFLCTFGDLRVFPADQRYPLHPKDALSTHVYKDGRLCVCVLEQKGGGGGALSPSAKLNFKRN